LSSIKNRLEASDLVAAASKAPTADGVENGRVGTNASNKGCFSVGWVWSYPGEAPRIDRCVEQKRELKSPPVSWRTKA